MQNNKFKELITKLEQDLSFINNEVFKEELKNSISTPQEWTAIANLYILSASELLKFIQELKVPNFGQGEIPQS